MRLSPGMSTPSKRGMMVVFWLSGSALFLFVSRVFANDADDIVAANDFARFAQSFYGGSDFHFLLCGCGDDESL